jgi:hypothetical protein
MALFDIKGPSKTFLINPSQRELLADPYDHENRFLFVHEGLKLLLPLYKRFLSRADHTFQGRNRTAIVLNDRIVVKLPMCYLGFEDNEWEGSVSNTPESFDDQNYEQFPLTRLTYQNKVPVLFMQKVHPLNQQEIVDHFGSEPDWVKSIDSGQVGITRFGRLVAYDYGCY